MVSQSRALPVLITRPEPQASRFASDLQERYGGLIEVVLSPLLSPRLLHPKLPAGPFGAIVLTSETGARAAAAARDLPKRAYCVGDRTAEVARSVGFDAQSADGDADRLFDLLRNRSEDAPFLHLRGRDARGDLSARLSAAGVAAQQAVVYVQEPAVLSAKAVAALNGFGPVIVPLLSPRTAEIFLGELNNLPNAPQSLPRLRIAALSPAIAAVFANCPAQHIETAAAPSQAELFLVLDRFIFTA
ncbi:MAG: uroporphyrinogen-III synthase [Paracoccaceae bacterium]